MRARPGQSLPSVYRATAFEPVGWGGSTTQVRFVGGTTSGAPTSGTYEAGDTVVATDGALWICTASGTPGTWVGTVTTNATSIVINGHTLTASGGDLFINGARLAKASELTHNHDTTYAKTASTATVVGHSHP